MAANQMNEISTAENRFNMVECQLKPGGIRDYRLTNHMNSIPREAFISGTVRALAYADLQLQCAAGEASRTMLTPTALALLIELADVKPEDVVLDIAGGTGYSAAVLAGLSSTVIAPPSGTTPGPAWSTRAVPASCSDGCARSPR